MTAADDCRLAAVHGLLLGYVVVLTGVKFSPNTVQFVRSKASALYGSCFAFPPLVGRSPS